MRRVIYCPNDSMFHEAEQLSKTNFLQVQLGDSANTENLEFNRSIVSVIDIPEFRFYKNIQTVDAGFHQIVHYTNDFIVFDKTLQISFNSVIFSPVMVEKHNARFAFVCSDTGFFSANIIHGGQIMESFDFYVN